MPLKQPAPWCVLGIAGHGKTVSWVVQTAAFAGLGSSVSSHDSRPDPALLTPHFPHPSLPSPRLPCRILGSMQGSTAAFNRRPIPLETSRNRLLFRSVDLKTFFFFPYDIVINCKYLARTATLLKRIFDHP